MLLFGKLGRPHIVSLDLTLFPTQTRFLVHRPRRSSSVFTLERGSPTPLAECKWRDVLARPIKWPPITHLCAQIACREVEQIRQRWRHSQTQPVHGVDSGKHTISQSAESKQTILERRSAAHHVLLGPLLQLHITVTFSTPLRFNSLALLFSRRTMQRKIVFFFPFAEKSDAIVVCWRFEQRAL